MISLSVTVLVIALCLALEGFFSGTEIAIVSANKTRLKMQADQGNKAAKLALWMIQNPARFFSTTILGTNMCVVIASSILTIYLITRFGPEYEAFAILISPLVLIVGELLPKSVYQHFADWFVLRAPRFLFVFYIMFYPLVMAFSYLTNMLLGGVKSSDQRADQLTREELAALLVKSEHPKSDVRASEREMVQKILRLSQQQAVNIMIPLVDMDSASILMSREAALEAFDLHGHSKLPIFDNRVHNIVGILYLIDLLTADDAVNIRDLVRPVMFVPENMKLDTLYRLMRNRDQEMAIVVDEYGGTTGLATMEMVLEEIVGDIRDEFELDEQLWRQASAEHFIVRGRLEIEVANEVLGLGIPAGPYETVAGYLLHHFGRIPKVKETIVIDGWHYVVRVATQRAILEVDVRRESTSI